MLFKHTGSCECGLSDFHHTFFTVKKGHYTRRKDKWITYRSYKHFQDQDYLDDVSRIPFHMCDVFDDSDDAYWAYNKLLRDVIDTHTPQKRKNIKASQPAFMNSSYRRELRKKSKLRTDYYKCRNSVTWELYRKQRNRCTALRCQSVKNYFHDKCSNGVKNKDFWPTKKTFLTNKGFIDNNEITLVENNVLINDPGLVCETMNTFCTNITSGLGLPEITDPSNCNSVNAIHDFVLPSNSAFSFQPVPQESVAKKLKQLNGNKCTGPDLVPARLLKVAADELAPSVTSLINMGISKSQFPRDMKCALSAFCHPY